MYARVYVPGLTNIGSTMKSSYIFFCFVVSALLFLCVYDTLNHTSLHSSSSSCTLRGQMPRRVLLAYLGSNIETSKPKVSLHTCYVVWWEYSQKDLTETRHCCTWQVSMEMNGFTTSITMVWWLIQIRRQSIPQRWRIWVPQSPMHHQLSSWSDAVKLSTPSHIIDMYKSCPSVSS